VATWSIGVFASLALALSLIGVYGVIAYDVSQRAREISIRMALGADRHAVLGLVMRGGARTAMWGIVLGAGFAFGLARLASGLLFGVTAYDPATYVALAVALLGFAAAAAYVPARRATPLDPLSSLRG
jgi:ABC-type antimicrobial peptide transport system permease subunit